MRGNFKTYSVRLEESDAAIWNALMKRWKLDRSETLRHLLRITGDYVLDGKYKHEGFSRTKTP